ncbi:hypothetical protein H2203_009175 [Taxawa tesnikishii (nom. ined.)]|nr:hypothetical protein H2203_009175 [Dothideales sp. JES 119]
MVSTGSNDLFRNKLPLWIIKLSVVLVIVPVVVVALRSPDILQIYLISDLVSAALVPCLVVGLVDRFYWWQGFEVIVGGLGGLLSVFIFGTVYLGSALEGAKLLLLEDGAFVAAPVGGLIFAVVALALRLSFLWIRARVKGERFTGLDRPLRTHPGGFFTGDGIENEFARNHHDAEGYVHRTDITAGKVSTF